MKSSKFFPKKLNFGFTLVELMTALIIFTLLAMIGFPTYQEYQNRSHLAEAESVVGTMERHSVAYLLEHGSFYSADPSPSSVPGMDSPGDSAAFSGGNDWTALGLPVAEGSDVNFSYQAFAGQTPLDSTTPVINDHLHGPTENMNLERGTYTVSNSRPQNVRVAKAAPASPLIDWSIMNVVANAQEATDVTRSGRDPCIDTCVKMGGLPEECEQKCFGSGEGTTDLKAQCYEKCGGENDCFNQCYFGTSGDSSCVSQCTKSGASTAECNQKCGATDPKTVDDYAQGNSCNRQCRGDMDCWASCMAGDRKCSEGRDHQQERCRDSCGGDRKREENCMNGNDDGDNDEIAGNCCRARCHGDQQCIQACNTGGSCEAFCRGNQECIDRCRHGSCEASCHGDHRCIQRCGQQNCQHTCGGNREREDRCNQQQDDDNEQCVTTCVTRCGQTTHCRRRCDTNGGHDCEDGQHWNGSRCVPDEDPTDGGGDPSCPEGQTWNGSQCVTTTGGGGGGPTDPPDCPPGTSYSVSTGQCVTTTGGGGGGPSDPPGDPGSNCEVGTIWNGSACVPTDGGHDTAGGECASFGVATPADFGVPTNVKGLDFTVFSAVANLRRGRECTLVVKVIQTRNRQPVRSQASVVINGGE